jgi:DMSO/TMAO reductase YedYZ molybdopterin-dependent catalytic subunit
LFRRVTHTNESRHPIITNFLLDPDFHRNGIIEPDTNKKALHRFSADHRALAASPDKYGILAMGCLFLSALDEIIFCIILIATQRARVITGEWKTMKLFKFWPISLTFILILMSFPLAGCSKATYTTIPGEVEATTFQGSKLTAIKDQRNNALKGTQVINKDTYTLTIDGLVDKPLTLTYADLQAYAQESWLMDLNCVEGWSFTAKWTGPALSAILKDAGVKPEAVIAIFYTADVPSGYTSLDLNYINSNDIILAMKDNDITLTPDRGFPFQVTAKTKFGYKWAKWITITPILTARPVTKQILNKRKFLDSFTC